MKSVRILGIDPGLQTTGFGVVDATGHTLTYVASGTITTTHLDRGNLPARLTLLLGPWCQIGQADDGRKDWRWPRELWRRQGEDRGRWRRCCATQQQPCQQPGEAGRGRGDCCPDHPPQLCKRTI